MQVERGAKLSLHLLDAVRFAQLSGPRQTLVPLCQDVNYGFIQELSVRDSDPVFNPPPLVLLDVKLDSDNGPRPEADLADFELRHEFCRLMIQLDELINARIERIEVRAGIPRRVLFRVAGATGANFRNG